MEIFRILQVSIDFSTNVLIFSLFLGAPPHEPHFRKSRFPKFSKFSLHFRENFQKILKIFKKSQYFLKNFQKT